MTSGTVDIRRTIAAALLALLPLTASGEGRALLESRVDAIDGDGFRISNLAASVELTAGGIRGGVRIGSIEIPDAELAFSDVSVRCGSVRLTGAEFRCGDAALTADFPGLGRHTVPGAFAYQRTSGTTRVQLARLPVAGSDVRIRATAGEAGVAVEFAGEALQVEALLAVVGAFGLDLTDVAAGGAVSASGSMRLAADGSFDIDVQATLDDVSLSNAAGTAVTAGIGGAVDLRVAKAGETWCIDATVDADAGEIYVEPVYANVGDHAVRLSAADVRTADFRSFRIGKFRLRQATLLEADGNLSIALPETDDAPLDFDGRVNVTDTAVEAVYTSLLQVLAAGTMLGDLETAGRIGGTITFEDGAPAAARLDLVDVILDDRQRRFAIYGLAGHVDWPGPDGEPGDAGNTTLRWDSATAFSIPLGAAELELRLGGDDVELLAPLELPTMGGALRVNRLAMRDYGTDRASGLLDAELEPIQLGQLTGAFGWPAFSGSLSGRLPLLQYEGNAMTVGGTLTAEAFDGTVEIANLRLEQPFGRVPRLYGDLRMRRLDLERLTNTFSFGLIQGRLSGDVTGLAMANWQPMAMDLHLYTPPGDDSRHRISQRAVENLANVGGGGGGAAVALSSGFLKFFEVFAYDRIGLRCVLKDGVCAMSGAGDAGQSPLGDGYYIVRGSGLPRIDVIGYRRQVNWNQLLNQLSSITKSDAPIVN